MQKVAFPPKLQEALRAQFTVLNYSTLLRHLCSGPGNGKGLSRSMHVRGHFVRLRKFKHISSAYQAYDVFFVASMFIMFNSSVVRCGSMGPSERAFP